jgi:demethoxyubiquinone hydroxylase (CLK1/Coq7/Cat5 family)
MDEQVAKKHVEDRIDEAKNRQRELKSQLENLKIKLEQKKKQKEGFEAQLAQLNETNE